MQKHFVSEEDLLQDGFRLGVDVYNSGFRPTFIVGLWRGGGSVGIVVQECLQYLGVEADHVPVRTSYRGLRSYEKLIAEPSPVIQVDGTQYLVDNLNASDSLLIVDDVYSTGLNVQAVIDRLTCHTRRNMAHDTRVAVPWYKPSRNRTARAPDYYLHRTDHWLVMPYELCGLTREEIAANKPYVLPLLAGA